jgi:hypothetical protein
MADVAGALEKQLLHFALQQRFVKVDTYRQLRVRTRQLGVGSQIGHPNPPLYTFQPKKRKNPKTVFGRIDALPGIAWWCCHPAVAGCGVLAPVKNGIRYFGDRTGDYSL